MSAISEQSVRVSQGSAEELAVIDKVSRRLVWFLVVLFFISYLDRINISFAALSMNKDLGLTATMFGFATSIFYVAYLCAEIPSNMLMPYFGARIWIPRIMITWGLASVATLFATGPNSLYVLRVIVGLAEAGFVPGILLYITYWFPATHRARATSFFIMAQPITIMIGSTISGLILEMHGFFGLKGWQWLFLLEGLPAIVLGVVAYFYLDDNPTKAKWLTPREKEVLAEAIARDDLVAPKNKSEGSRFGMVSEFFSAPVLLLSFTYVGLVVSLVTNSSWVPQIVRAVHPNADFLIIGVIGAIPALAAVLVMPQWGKHSDNTNERKWHVALPMIVAAAGWMMVAWLESPVAKLVGLILCAVGTFSAQGIFWTLPPLFLSPKARPIGIAMISTIGLLGTSIGPITVGWLKDYTGTFGAGLSFVAGCVIAGALAVIIMQSHTSSPERRS
ncbi:MFS transporter [Bradyrhizobium jicamae]|uniref:MFS transporter n=1 Tax=Bradyrhizobium jicamae TaxID=280332 RepID=A0ABS5FVY8_9BRAD|nr:MFS transporter [Bradyrhizobium jicamae]MBR0800431.1 MFS transporter [Bradyrhizobium jicamae]